MVQIRSKLTFTQTETFKKAAIAIQTIPKYSD